MSPDSRLVFELQRVMSQFKRAVMLKGSNSKLKGAEKQVLFLVDELSLDNLVTISEIASKTGVTLAAITHQINSLQKKGLIERLSSSDDGRTVLINLTNNGRTQVVKLKQEFADKTKFLVEFLGARDTKSLIRLVAKMSKFPDYIKK